MLNALSLFTYLRFPSHLRRMLCTTNWIERLNRSYKRTLHMRAAMCPFCWGALTKGRGN